jgi:hypothetical protein
MLFLLELDLIQISTDLAEEQLLQETINTATLGLLQ